VLRFAKGYTTDIINVVVQDYKDNRHQVKQLAQTLKGKTVLETASNVHAFVRNNIRYQLDPAGKQFSKTPSRTIADGFGDCKSYSILAASLLHNLGIKHGLKFVNYSNAHNNPTHVYVVAFDGNTPITVDACLPHANSEKPYNPKSERLIMSTEIHSLSGVGNAAQVNPNRRNNRQRSGKGGGRRFWRFNTKGPTSAADMDLGLLREKLFLDYQEARKKANLKDPKQVQELNAKVWALRGVTDAHDALRRGDYAEVEGIGSALEHGVYVPGESHADVPYLIQQEYNRVSGIGSVDEEAIGRLKLKKAKVFKKVGKAVAKKVGKTVRKAAKVAKKGIRAAVKVVSFPARLAAKGILEVTLPKAAPFFLYTFITNANTVSKLPSKVQRKRTKALKIKKFIVNAIGMKESHFNKIVRNGIKKKFGADPETILKARVQGPISGIFGIGAAARPSGGASGSSAGGALVSLAASASGLGPLLEILKVIGNVFKKSGESASADDAPNPDDDFAGNEQVLEEELTETAPPPRRLTAPKAAVPVRKKTQPILPKRSPVVPNRKPVQQPVQPVQDDWQNIDPAPPEVDEEVPTAFEQTFSDADYPETPPEMEMDQAPQEVLDEPEAEPQSSGWGDY
jgi:hypothetical protein